MYTWLCLASTMYRLGTIEFWVHLIEDELQNEHCGGSKSLIATLFNVSKYIVCEQWRSRLINNRMHAGHFGPKAFVSCVQNSFTNNTVSQDCNILHSISCWLICYAIAHKLFAYTQWTLYYIMITVFNCAQVYLLQLLEAVHYNIIRHSLRMRINIMPSYN